MEKDVDLQRKNEIRQKALMHAGHQWLNQMNAHMSGHAAELQDLFSFTQLVTICAGYSCFQGLTWVFRVIRTLMEKRMLTQRLHSQRIPCKEESSSE